MAGNRVGAVVIVENDEPAGIFTRRDALERVVLQLKSLDTPVSSVMTAPVETMSQDSDLSEALQQLAKKPFNHVPIVDDDGKVVGLATTKPMMKRMIDRLSEELGSLESFITADGIGG